MTTNKTKKVKSIREAALFIGVSAVALTTAMASPVLAQDTSQADADVVVATGIRQSLQQALDVKRSQSVVADVINSDDVGKLPDNNIAEALSRVPGIQIERNGNEGSQIQLRGLDSVRLEVNGHTLASPDAEPQASSLEAIPSQFFRQIQVLKSYSADQTEGGLGGTVKFDTFRPFDFKEGQAFVVNAEAGYSDGADKAFPRLNAYASKTFEDTAIGDIGFLYGGVLDQRVNLREDVVVRNYDYRAYPSLDVDGDGTPGENSQLTCLNASGSAVSGTDGTSVGCELAGGFNVFGAPEDALFFPERIRAAREITESNRQSHLLTTQWYPNDNVEIIVDYLRVQERPSNVRSDLFFNNQIIRSINSGETTLPGSIDFDSGDRGVNSYLIGDPSNTLGANIFWGSISREAKSTTENFDIDAKFDISDRLVARARYNHAEGKSDINTFDVFQNLASTVNGNSEDRNTSPFQRIIVGERNLSLELFPNGTPISSITSGSVSAVQPTDFTSFINGGSENSVFSNNQEDSYSLDFDYDLNKGIISSVELGARFAQNESSTRRISRSTFADSNRGRFAFSDLAPGTTVTLDISNFTQSNGINLPGQYDIVNPNIFLDESSRNDFRNFLYSSENANPTLTAFRDDLQNTNSVTEENIAGYVKANFGGDFGTTPFDGSIGLRYVNLDRSSASAVAGTSPAELSFDRWLPTFNFKLEVTPEIIARAAAARNISRYEFGNVRRNESLNEEQLTGNGGNPLLRPETVDSVDLSLEWYPAEGMAFAVAGYYKNIKDFIGSSVTQQCRLLPDTTVFSESDRVVLSPEVAKCLDGSLGAVSAPLGADGLITDAQLAAGVIALPFTFTGPVNGVDNVSLLGLELQYQQNLTFLPEPFDGLGVQVNYTYSDLNNSGLTAAGNALRRRGLSKNTFNLVGFYEKGPVELRAAYNYRSSFAPNIRGFANAGDGGELIRDGIGQVEASASYAVNDQIDVTLSGINLLAKDRYSFYDIPDRFGGLQSTERTFFAGIRYKY